MCGLIVVRGVCEAGEPQVLRCAQEDGLLSEHSLAVRGTALLVENSLLIRRTDLLSGRLAASRGRPCQETASLAGQKSGCSLGDVLCVKDGNHGARAGAFVDFADQVLDDIFKLALAFDDGGHGQEVGWVVDALE